MAPQPPCLENLGQDPLTRRCAPPSPPKGAMAEVIFVASRVSRCDMTS